MNQVLITVTGTQRDCQGEESRIELTTLGKHYNKNNVEYFTYQETELSGMEGTTTVVKLHSDYVSLVRMGTVELKQEFRLNEKSYSTYVTPYGNMKMAVMTHVLEHSFSGGTGALRIHYDLEMDGQWQSYNTLSVIIRGEK